MAILTVSLSMRLGEYSKQFGLENVIGLPNFFNAIPVTTFPEAAVSPIRMKLAVKDSLYLFSPMKVVAFRYLVYIRVGSKFEV